MPLVRACAPVPEVDLLAAYGEYCDRLGLTGVNLRPAARTFLRRWPDPQRWAEEPLATRLAVSEITRAFVMFLMLAGHLRPGYDYLIRRKLPGFWRQMPPGPLAEDLARFLAAAAELGFTERTRSGTASQVIGRLLIQTGRRLDALTGNDFDDLLAASAARHGGAKPSRHYSSAAHTARQVLFHLGVLTAQPVNATSLLRQSFEQRMRDATIDTAAVICGLSRPAYRHPQPWHRHRHREPTQPLRRAPGRGRPRPCQPGRSGPAPTHRDLPDRHRRRRPIPAPAHRSRPPNAVAGSWRCTACSTTSAEWDWSEAPKRRLVFRSDIPKLPRALPRYLTPDLDRRLTQALQGWPDRLPADALLLQRATGLRIGELADLELDCVHEIPGQGAWLKVPLGKLNTERMVPLDEETVALIDRIVAHRSPGRPLPHPRTARPTDFLLTHHGRRVTVYQLRDVMTRVARNAGLPHITPHQLRHTYATALVNAGVSLQSLMTLLGHVSAEMSLRYGRLFDATVRAEYERALTAAKAHLGTLPTEPPRGRTQLPIIDGDWKQAPAVKARLAGGFCVRAQVQGPCAYANICEHCPNFRTDTSYLPVLAAQRADTETLARDAEARGWTGEAERHRRLLERLDTHIRQAQTR